jgi:diguanylate cyclase (GGDEF)-like protein
MDFEASERVKVLESYHILDSGYEAGFDRITELARTIFEVPVSVICFLDRERQWFKSHPGFDRRQISSKEAICRFTIEYGDVLVIEDTTQEERTSQNPMVTGPANLRFYAGAPLISPEGARLGTVCVFDRKPRQFGCKDREILRQLADMTMQTLELRRLAENDWLTGAIARGAFERLSQGVLSRDIQRNTSSGLILFDIDFFKQLNDRYGHPAGDAVLKQVTTACQNALRKRDIFARVGGEEFTVLVPGTTPEIVQRVAARLKQVIATLPMDGLPQETRITASFGLTMVERGEEDIRPALKRADAALYKAKSSGRNCIFCSWEEEIAQCAE